MSIAPISTAPLPKPSFNFLLAARTVEQPKAHRHCTADGANTLSNESGSNDPPSSSSPVKTLIIGCAKSIACTGTCLLLHAVFGLPAAALPLVLLYFLQPCPENNNNSSRGSTLLLMAYEAAGATFGTLLASSPSGGALVPIPEMWQWLACIAWTALGAACIMLPPPPLGRASVVILIPLGGIMLPCRIALSLLMGRAVAYTALVVGSTMTPHKKNIQHNTTAQLLRYGAVLLSSSEPMLLVALGCLAGASAYAARAAWMPPYLHALLVSWRNSGAKTDMEEDDEKL